MEYPELSENRAFRIKELKRFFYPDTVAVIGATANPKKNGYSIMYNLKNFFEGRAVPVNPNYKELFGSPCYADVGDIPHEVDLAIVIVPAEKVFAVLRQCKESGIGSVLIESAGFAEAGTYGTALQKQIKDYASENDIRIWGPNCTGIVNTDNMLVTPFIYMPELKDNLGKAVGNVAIVAQSGMMAAGFMAQVLQSGYFGVSKACTIGNKVDIDEADIVNYLAIDENTRVITMYLESISSGRDFMASIRAAMKTKPVIMLKSGRTPDAKRAASSHTASLAGDSDIIDGFINQTGVIRVDDFIELVRTGMVFEKHPEPFKCATSTGREIAVVTVSGAAGVVACDILNSKGLNIAKFESRTKEALKRVFPPWMEPLNPVDTWPSIELHGVSETFLKCMRAVMPDPNVDGVLMMPFTANTDFHFPYDEISELVNEYDKPVVSWVFGDVRKFPEYFDNFGKRGICCFEEMKHCVDALNAYLSYSAFRRSTDSV